MDDAAVLILAAGASSRMRGRDKLLEEVEGAPLLSRQVRVAAATGRPVHVALRPGDAARRAVIGGADAIEVADADRGLARSIAAGLAALRDAAAVLVLPGDMPMLTTADLLAVLEAPQGPGEAARGATATGAPGHPVLIPRAAYPRFATLTGDGAAEALRGLPVRLVPLPGDRARFDLDTPEEWAVWREAE